MRNRITNRCASIVAALALGGAANAGIMTAYNNFGPDNDGFGYTAGTSWGMGSFLGPAQRTQSFTASASGPLSDIYLGVVNALGASNITVRLAVNNGFAGPTPADALETWSLPNLPGSSGAPVTHLVSQDNPVLEAGENYWLWITIGSGGGAWGHDGLGFNEPARTRNSDGAAWGSLNTQRAGALRIDVVPSPGTAALLGLVGIAAGARRRR